MHKTYNKFLILFATVLFLGGVYTYFSNGLDVNAAATDSAIASSSNSSSILGDSTDQISQDTAFLTTLTSLTKIKIDTSIFGNAAFNALNDNTVILEQAVAGRPNPFAPIDTNTPIDQAIVSPVITNLPTQITNKAAVLNGAISDNTSGVTSTYFEYGPTPTLGKSTAPAKQSLIGTFVTSINGLTPKTTYFFHAVAKINGTLHYGETLPFTTN